MLRLRKSLSRSRCEIDEQLDAGEVAWVNAGDSDGDRDEGGVLM